MEANQAKEAEDYLRESLKLNNAVPSAHMYLGIALLRLNKFDEAEKELLVATGANATYLAMANYYLGGIYWAKRDYKKAADELETYLKLSPKAPDAEQVRGTIKDLRSKS